MDDLTQAQAQADWLDYVENGERNGFTGMFSGRGYPKRIAEDLADGGLLERKDLQPADADGHLQWSRQSKQGYSLTEPGRAALLRWRARHG